jgi:prepilin signal peptidase PulO-like enzyme (type II secretory pathway)
MIALSSALAIGASAAAAITDLRTGHIPNVLTLPLLALGPAVAAFEAHGRGSSLSHAVFVAGLGVVVCGAVPYLLFRLGGMFGGDVKLLAGLGAVLGPMVGLEAELDAFVTAALFALGRMAFKGQLFAVLGRSAKLALRSVVKQVEPVPEELMTVMRFGPAAFVGVVVAALVEGAP